MDQCDPKDVALKALFLGPQAENAGWMEKEWNRVFQRWVEWRRSRFPQDGAAISASDQESLLFQERLERVDASLAALLVALDGESPKFTPRYLGHMMSELSLPAILGHLAVLLHNPNQTTKEVSKVTSGMESEAIADLLRMVGFGEQSARGHFTSGGTLANFEAVWHMLNRLDRSWALGLHLVAEGRLNRQAFALTPVWSWDWYETNLAAERARRSEIEPPLASYSVLALGHSEFARLYQRITGHPYRSPLLLAPASRHYSWPKAAALLGLGKESLRDVELDEEGRLCLSALRNAFALAKQEGRSVAMVVSVAGATGTGAVDPVAELSSLLEEMKPDSDSSIWHHVDAAYGGYFCTLLGDPKGKDPQHSLSANTAAALAGISSAHSVTLDPHKLGFVPYSCGAFLARDAQHYRAPTFDAPYLMTRSEDAWMHTLEGSRSGTGVAATWMANRSIGLDQDGYGRLLDKGLQAARELKAGLLAAGEELLVLPTDLNIVCFALARPGETLSSANRRTLACFEEFRKSPDFSVSKTELSAGMYARLFHTLLRQREMALDDGKIASIRLVLMNPFLTTRQTNTHYVEAFLAEVRRLAASL
jgi:glutamate/tyrosine decarboxylase-like PLP-dependent enzyme